MAFHPSESVVLSASADGRLRLWDVVSGQLMGDPLVGHTAAVTAVAYSPDGTLIASGSGDGTVRLWDATSGALRGEPLVGPDGVRAIAFSPDGEQLACGYADHTSWFWDVTKGRIVGEPLTGHHGAVDALCFSPYGTRIATGSADGTIRHWLGSAAGLLKLADALIQRDPPIFGDEERRRLRLDSRTQHEQALGNSLELLTLRQRWHAHRMYVT